jgi:hypothetical protein
MPSIPDKFAIPLKVIDPQAIKAVAPHAKGYMPSIGPADWQFSGPAGRDPYDIFGQPHLFYPYKVTSQDDWATVAARAKLKDDPKKLIRMNFFGIDDPAVVNWFLMHYVGCVRTRDGVNCSFSDDARPGIVWLPRSPHVVWPPKPTAAAWDCGIVPVRAGTLVAYKVSKRANIFGTGQVLEAGTYVASPQGLRLILSANSAEILFTLVHASEPKYTPWLNVVMAQPNGIVCGRSELDAGIWRQVADRGQALKRVAEWEMEILMGLLAGAGPALRLGIATASGIDYWLTDKLRKHENLARALITTFFELRKLRNTSPKLFQLFVGGLFAEAKKQLGEAVLADPSGALAGWVIGEAGPAAIAGRLDALGYVADVLENIAKELGKNLGKTAKDNAVAAYRKDSAAFATQLQKAGIAFTPGTEQELLAEIEKDPQAVERAMEKISAAFAAAK